jgi:hypothetical protein
VVPWTNDAPFNPKLISVCDGAKCRPQDGEQEHPKAKKIPGCGDYFQDAILQEYFLSRRTTSLVSGSTFCV